MPAKTSIEVGQERLEDFFPLPLPEELQDHPLMQCVTSAAHMIQKVRKRVQDGARHLAKTFPGVRLDPVAIEQQLAANLAEPLLLMMSRVIVLELNVARLEGVLEGGTPKERFISFLCGLREPVTANQLFSEYPVLQNEIERLLERWCIFSLEFLHHLCEDWQQLCHEFFGADPGPMTKVRGGAGDTHRGGRSVMIVSFANGDRIVYKPRSLSADQHFQQLLAWVNMHGSDCKFRLLKVLDRGDYGWSEFVSAAPCNTQAELSRFYCRLGSYLALLYAIEARDFHCENLIAAGEDPMLVDLEALFHPRLRNVNALRADELAGVALGYSVLAIGLLPRRMSAEGEQPGLDMSGLSNIAGQLTPFGVPHWEQAGTDEMHLIRKRVELPGADNCPTLAGIPAVAFDYAREIVSGFESTYRAILKHSLEFLRLCRAFSNDEVRVIARATRTYATLFHESFHPDLLRDSRSRESFFDKLREAVPQFPELEKLVAAEKADLLRGDIPLFTTRPDSVDVWTSTGQCIPNCFVDSGLSLVQRRLSQLSEKDLQLQLWIVRASIATMHNFSEAQGPAQPGPAAVAETAGPKEFISAARQIGDRLTELAFGGDDSAAWIGLVGASEREWLVSPLGSDLYDGLPGVILFLAHLGNLSRDPRYTTLARGALKTLRARVKDWGTIGSIGAFNGVAGTIYLYSHLGAIWQDTSLHSDAEELAQRTADSVSTDRTFDVIGGAAGCALALLALHHCRPTSETLNVAVACGEHLLRNAQKQSRGIGWHCIPNGPAPLAGFAHGNAGIAYALFALHGATQDRRFEQAAILALEYERSLYSPEQRNWPDLRDTTSATFTTAWCHGAPGIGLSRLCTLRFWNDPQLLEEIEAAMATTAASVSGDPTLCHGDLGKADILLQASELLAVPRWRESAAYAVSSAVETARESGWKCSNPLGVESPGLMTGLAGIGYSLLRHAAPTRVASVLALDPPVLS